MKPLAPLTRIVLGMAASPYARTGCAHTFAAVRGLPSIHTTRPIGLDTRFFGARQISRYHGVEAGILVRLKQLMTCQAGDF
jgi:hypothetical protein